MGVYVEPRRSKPYGAILADTPDPPDPPKDDMTADDIIHRVATITIPPDISDGAAQRFRDEGCWERDRVFETTHDGQPTQTPTMSRGAWALYFNPVYYREMETRIAKFGQPQGSPEQIYNTWGGWSGEALNAAIAAYRTAQPPGPNDPQHPVTPPPSGAFRRIAGALRRVGMHFHDDNGYITPRGGSCLYGLCDGVNPDPLLDQYAAEGIQYVRVFAGALPRHVNGVDRGFSQTPEAALERLGHFLARANVRGLRVQVCMITDSALYPYDVYGHAVECARITTGTGNWLEGGNEVEDNEQRQDIDWQRVLDECRAAGYSGLFTVGAAKLDELDVNTGEYWPAEIGDFASTHPWRNAEPHWMGDGCRLREGEGIQGTHNCPIAFGEPDRADTLPDGYAFLIGALGAGFNAAVVLHTNEGRDCRPLTGTGFAALRAFVQGHQALEAGPWQWQNAQRPGHWPDSPCVAGAFEEGGYGPPHMLPGGHVWRVFSFVKDGRGYSVPTGHRPEHAGAFQIGNGYRQGADRASRPGARLVEIAR